MATVTPILWPHKEDKNGRRPLWLRIEAEGRTLYASLGVKLRPKDWNERRAEVRKGHKHAETINALIQRRLAEVEEARLHLLIERAPVTAEALKAVVKPDASAASPCFLRYALDFLADVERRGNVGRFKREQTVFNKLREFAGEPLPFDRLTTPFLRAYETHLTEKGNNAATVQGNMKVVRAHVRRAMKEGIIGRDADPFFAYTPPKATRPERHKLTADELARIEALRFASDDEPEHGDAAPLASRVRDAFLFSLYAAGMRFADVARLTGENIRVEAVTTPGGETVERWRLTYTMGKTSKRATLLLIPKARALAVRYLLHADGTPKKPSDFLFPMLAEADLSTPRSTWNAIGAQNALHNKYLRKIAEAAKIEGHLSFHVARHSFADLARRNGWDVYAISKALAHSSLAITERYLAGFDGELVDRKLDALFHVAEGTAPAKPADAP